MADKRAHRLQIMLTADEVRAVEEWRFENRMPSRSAAVRALMNLGLKKAEPLPVIEDIVEGSVPSADVGVVDSDEKLDPILDPDDKPGVLIVFANPLIGHGLKSLLEDAGFSVIGPAADNEQALTLARERKPALAVLDPELNPDEIADLVEALADRKIPVLFCGTNETKDNLPKNLQSVPIVSRLSAPNSLAETVSSMIE